MINKAFENGKEKYGARDFKGAVMDFTLALEKDPGNPEILYQRAMTYFHLQKHSLALLDMDEAVKYQPNYSFRYSSRAYMRDAIGDVVGAIADYKKAIELDPEDVIAYNNLGILEEKMGRKQISEAYFNKADKLIELPTNKTIKEVTGLTNNVNNTRSSSPLPVVDKTKANSSLWIEVLKVFTQKDSFKEFLSFIKSGFKLPPQE
jgi:tetratricopeptide (TPR) repeat protein